MSEPYRAPEVHQLQTQTPIFGSVRADDDLLLPHFLDHIRR